ncbi:PREDICTED: immunoglobulin superfamily member 21-like [Branchiostoma belcheri]|uniref:Immunoglobulin superfamily member 21-like n=1 Tax=Branchiostoma belcheri TaxID=7741 RepID=A0A6P4YU07_BRABE|nr:PREDICTED: immunoglobulin superfamily member 21-like [Branchiostoma belcheri]
MAGQVYIRTTGGRLSAFVLGVGFFLAVTAAVRAQTGTVNGGPDVYQSIGRTVTLSCTYSLSGSATLREIKWYRVSDGGDREPVLFYYSGESAYTFGLYRNRASLVNTDTAAQDASLRLSNLQFSDSGTYECLVGAGGSGLQPWDGSVEINLVALGKSWI